MIQFSKVKYNFITPFSIIYAIHNFIINSFPLWLRRKKKSLSGSERKVKMNLNQNSVYTFISNEHNREVEFNFTRDFYEYLKALHP